MNVNKLLTEHHFEFLSIKAGCTGSSEYTLIKIRHCWKSHVSAHSRKMVLKAYMCSLVAEFLEKEYSSEWYGLI